MKYRIHENPVKSNVRVGVYGTLKKGHRNWKYMLQNCKQLENEELVGFQLYRVSASFPGAIESKNALPMPVEVYEVSPEKLYQLDSLEGIPHIYRRIYIEELDLFLYLYNQTVLDEEKIEENVWY